MDDNLLLVMFRVPAISRLSDFLLQTEVRSVGRDHPVTLKVVLSRHDLVDKSPACAPDKPAHGALLAPRFEAPHSLAMPLVRAAIAFIVSIASADAFEDHGGTTAPRVQHQSLKGTSDLNNRSIEVNESSSKLCELPFSGVFGVAKIAERQLEFLQGIRWHATRYAQA